MSFPNTVQIWADGACSGNPGPGGWAAVLVHVPTGAVKELSSRVDHTTNMRMELTAIEQGLLAIHKPGQEVTVYTDALNAINWLTGAWKVKDAEIGRLVGNIRAVVREMDHTVTYQHVNGHSGVALNERANSLAQAEAQQARRALRQVA
jgi:ribonuclease HI